MTFYIDMYIKLFIIYLYNINLHYYDFVHGLIPILLTYIYSYNNLLTKFGISHGLSCIYINAYLLV